MQGDRSPVDTKQTAAGSKLALQGRPGHSAPPADESSRREYGRSSDQAQPQRRRLAHPRHQTARAKLRTSTIPARAGLGWRILSWMACILITKAHHLPLTSCMRPLRPPPFLECGLRIAHLRTRSRAGHPAHSPQASPDGSPYNGESAQDEPSTKIHHRGQRAHPSMTNSVGLSNDATILPIRG